MPLDQILQSFRERFVNGDMLEIKGAGKDTYILFKGKEIADFITSAFKSREDELVREIEGRTDLPILQGADVPGYINGYNQALSDILAIIKR